MASKSRPKGIFGLHKNSKNRCIFSAHDSDWTSDDSDEEFRPDSPGLKRKTPAVKKIQSTPKKRVPRIESDSDESQGSTRRAANGGHASDASSSACPSSDARNGRKRRSVVEESDDDDNSRGTKKRNVTRKSYVESDDDDEDCDQKTRQHRSPGRRPR